MDDSTLGTVQTVILISFRTCWVLKLNSFSSEEHHHNIRIWSPLRILYFLLYFFVASNEAPGGVRSLLAGIRIGRRFSVLICQYAHEAYLKLCWNYLLPMCTVFIDSFVSTSRKTEHYVRNSKDFAKEDGMSPLCSPASQWL